MLNLNLKSTEAVKYMLWSGKYIISQHKMEIPLPTSVPCQQDSPYKLMLCSKTKFYSNSRGVPKYIYSIKTSGIFSSDGLMQLYKKWRLEFDCFTQCKDHIASMKKTGC